MRKDEVKSCACCQKEEYRQKSGGHQPNETSRRRFLGLAVGVINVGLVATFVGPIMGFLGAPLKHRTRPEWIPLAKLDDLPEGAAKEVTYSLKVKDGYHYVERKYSVYLRRIEDQVICLDPACTHLGCRVDYQAEYDRFLCPCHGGVFDNRGKVVSGPPPRALDQHRLRIQDGQIWILREV